MAFTVTTISGTSSRSLSGARYTDVFRVESTDVVHPAVAQLAVPITIGTIFAHDPSARCTDVSSDWEDVNKSRKVFQVTATYETPSGGEEKVENEDPLQDRPDIRWGDRTVRLPVTFTSDDPPQRITNSAGEPFDPPPEEDFRILVYAFSHNVASYDEGNATSYRGAINSDAVTIGGIELEPYQARIAAITATNQERNGIRFWRESVVVEIVDDWRLRLVDEGLRKKVEQEEGENIEPVYLGEGNFGSVREIFNADGVPIVEPVLLDGAGGVLNGGDPVLLTFNTAAKPLRPFGPLGLPTTNEP